MPTLKQRKAFLATGVNGGNISQAMKTAGYSKSVSKRTDKLTRTKGWQELMNEFIPDSLLAKKHKELLTVPIRKRRYIKGELIDETEELDSQAISKGLDMGYKLKGKYAPEKIDHTTLGEKITTENKEQAQNALLIFLDDNTGNN